MPGGSAARWSNTRGRGELRETGGPSIPGIAMNGMLRFRMVLCIGSFVVRMGGMWKGAMTRVGAVCLITEIAETLVSFSCCGDAPCVSLASLCLCGEEMSAFSFTAETQKRREDDKSSIAEIAEKLDSFFRCRDS